MGTTLRVFETPFCSYTVRRTQCGWLP